MLQFPRARFDVEWVASRLLIPAPPLLAPHSAGSLRTDRRVLQTLPFLISSARYSEVRHASATIVRVGFLSGLLTNGAASATNRFLTSCDWQYLFSAEVFGSSPMRMEPTSWMISPPV